MKFLKYFLIFGILFFSLNLIFAHQPFYQVNVSDTVEINEWNLCWQVTNNGLFDIMVPTNSALEWYLFNQSHPSNIELNECGQNNFGDGSNGDLWIKEDGIYQDLGSGYNKIYDKPQWPSVEDGDMVVINARDFRVDSGVIFTTTNRCRGLMIYATGDMIVEGTISMTARGAHANPADSVSTINSPVPSSDGNAVPNEGLVIRRSKSDWSDITNEIIYNAHASSINDFIGTHNSNNLFYGTGLDGVYAESNQEEVEDGLVIKIPRVGGSGGAAVGCGCDNYPGKTGRVISFGTGGGGSGNARYAFNVRGGYGTCFSGGTGSGNADHCGHSGHGNPSRSASDFGGAGSPICGVGTLWYTSSAGVGNPNGAGESFESGTGGLLLIFVRGNVKFGSEGLLTAQGVNQIPRGRGSGASGGGIVSLMYGNELINYSSLNINVNGGRSRTYGGHGGSGSIIGPIKISKGLGPCDYGNRRINGVCQEVNWVEKGDWKYNLVTEGVCVKEQTIECQNIDGDILDDSLCGNLEKPIYSTRTDLIDCTIILKRNNCVGDEYPGIEIRDWPDTGYLNGLWGPLFYNCGSTGDWCHRANWDYKTCSVEYVGREYTDYACTEKKRCCDDNGNDNGGCSPRNPNFIITCLPDCPEDQILYGKNCKDEQWIEENSFTECGDSIIVNHKGMNDWEAETKAGIYGTIEVGGRCWMDRNIGATCDFSSSDYDTSSCYGWYYQWGYLEAYTGDVDPDYEERPTSRTSWEGDPCTKIFGSNWRIPTKEELNSLHNGIDGTGGVDACIDSNSNIGKNMWDCLKMPQSGYLDGEIQIEGIGSAYWGVDYEGLVDGVSTGGLLYNSGSSLEYLKAPQWMGGNIRCIKNN